MSGSRLVRNSSDLARLVDEGYSVRIAHGYLVVDDIPYVDAALSVQWGSFLCPLDVAGDRTAKPSDHVMGFTGAVPCDKDGHPIRPDFAQPGLASGWSAGSDCVATCGFSQKTDPVNGYANYYDKVTTYAAILASPARAIDPSATPQKGKPFTTDEGDGVFTYIDTFSSRAGITARNQRLQLAKVAIVGLGGTGGYLLDLLAKCPILNIHLYDGDVFSTHNAFRAPGAATLPDLQAAMLKVDYYAKNYAAMRRQLHAHPAYVTAENAPELLDADFVFLAMDSGPDKRAILDALIDAEIPFIDTGVGVSEDPGGIAGQVRVTTGLPGSIGHITAGGLISALAAEANEYDTNLQVAELNMLAAVMAVVRFKKYLSFYADVEGELHSVYRIDTNETLNKYGATDESENAGEDAA